MRGESEGVSECERGRGREGGREGGSERVCERGEGMRESVRGESE